ncbi:hypothetical protein EG327_011623 [Venturia inaequalis]|uniref:F-box domain-containing protein n=1 Tax=Venturia inaequalis TaxID=5025 RepID=A0A8H3VP90_VENIN|nr:hypothetical protein EG327_011623 [Venturia inaequalis]
MIANVILTLPTFTPSIANVATEYPKLQQNQLSLLRSGELTGHFDFLKLPLELREAIYELLFEDNKHYQPKKLRLKVRNSRIHRPECKLAHNCTLERPMPTKILRTCQQIYYEARAVLYRMRPAEIYVGTWAKNMHFLDPIDVAPLTNARKLLIKIAGRKDAGPIQYAQKRQGSLGNLLAKYTDVFISSHVALGPNRDIRLQFEHTRKPLAEDEQQSLEEWYLQVWHWAQAGEAVKAMRKDLKERAPAMNRLLITSNVEGKISKVKTIRYDASRVWYRNSATKKEGFLGINASGKVVPVTAPAPKADFINEENSTAATLDRTCTTMSFEISFEILYPEVREQSKVHGKCKEVSQEFLNVSGSFSTPYKWSYVRKEMVEQNILTGFPQAEPSSSQKSTKLNTNSKAPKPPKKNL